jgi:hypothetical protein
MSIIFNSPGFKLKIISIVFNLTGAQPGKLAFSYIPPRRGGPGGKLVFSAYLCHP